MINVDELISVLENNKIAIYGTGFVGKRFYNILVSRGLEKRVDCFVVSNIQDSPKEIYGINVKEVSGIQKEKSRFVCIAVHEAIQSEIVNILNKEKIENYVWIYPYMWELALGKPIERNKWIDVEKIIYKCNDYRVAIRYLAIENYFGKNDYGFNLYIKAQRMHCEKSTAEKRLQQFCSLIHCWEVTGYNPDHKILVLKNGDLIDGFHRITLAQYYHIQKVKCDLFEDASYWRELEERDKGVELLLGKDIDAMLGAGFTFEEIKIIDKKYRKIRGENSV